MKVQMGYFTCLSGAGVSSMASSLVLALALAWATQVLANDSRPIVSSAPSAYVNLNAPGALEKLKQSNAKHYETFAKILHGLNERSFESVPRWIRTTFDARGVLYSPILLTSFPPQRDLSLTIDRTRYSARITLAPDGASIFSTK